MATAGSIVIDLVMRTGLFETDSARAEKRLKELQKTAKQAGAAIGTALVAAGTAIAVLTKEAIDNADAVRDMGIRLGTSTETLSAFGYAANQTGTDIDTLGRGLKVLAKNAADALNPTSEQAKVFEALGIKVTDATGKLKDLAVLVPEIADKFAGMADGTTKAALAQSLFGKAGLDLTEFLNSGSEGLAQFTKRAEELGIVIGQDTANAADEFNDKLGDARALVGGLGLAIAQELLPDLNRMIGGFTDGAGAGEKFKETASGIADTLRILASAVGIISSVFEVAGTTLAAFAAQAGGVWKFLTGDFREGINQYRAAAEGFDAEINEALGRGPSSPSSGSDNSRSTGGRRGRVVSIRPANTVNERALQNALGGVTDPKTPKGRGGGKSEAEKAAEQLDASYERLKQNLNETYELFGKNTEAAQVLYDTQNGELAKLSQARKDELVQLAERNDAQKLSEELADAAKDRMKDEIEAMADHSKAVKDQIADMEFENSLIGLTNIAREKAIALRYANVDAMSEEGQKITGLIDEYHKLNDSYGFVNDTLDGFGDAMASFADRTKSAKEAFGDWADDLYSTAVQWLSDQAMNSLKDWLSGKQDGKGGYGGGKEGGGFDWGSLLSSVMGFFGGGKAGGGDLLADRSYLVGEQGPERFVPRTSGTLIPAMQTAGMQGRGGSGVTQNNKFVFAAPTSRRTQEQVAQRSAFELAQAQRRNG